MNSNDLISSSKFLSLVLRHRPDKINLELDKEGWAYTKSLSDKSGISISDIEEIVRSNNKKRFEFSSDKIKIRACQGHSVDVNLNLNPKNPPFILYHGTSDINLDSIKKEGLKAMNRQHVHLSLDKETAEKVGKRHKGKTVILEISAKNHVNSENAKYFESTNGVWLTENVPPNYIDFRTINEKD